MTAASAAPQRKPVSRIGYRFSPLPENTIRDTYRAFGCTAAAGLVLVVAEQTLNPDAPDECEMTREEFADILRCTAVNVDKAIDEAARCFSSEDGNEDGVIQFRRAGRKIALSLRDGRQALCRLRSLPAKELKRLPTREEREARKQAEEEARRQEIADAVEQRILAKAGELLCPRCGSEHTGLVCDDCGSVTPIVRSETEPAPPPPTPEPPPPPPPPAAKSTTPVAGSPAAESATLVVLSVLLKLLSSLFVTKFNRALDPAVASEIARNLRLDPAAVCTPEDESLIREYVEQFKAVENARWEKYKRAGLAKSVSFCAQVRATWRAKQELPPSPDGSPPLSVEERIQRARERLKKRGMA